MNQQTPSTAKMVLVAKRSQVEQGLKSHAGPHLRGQEQARQRSALSVGSACGLACTVQPTATSKIPTSLKLRSRHNT